MKKMFSKCASYLFLSALIATPSCNLKGKSRSQDYRYESPAVPIESNLFDLQDPEFGEKLENIFEMRAILLNSALIEILNDDCQNISGAYEEQLFDNSHNIANLFCSIYDAKMAHRLEILLNKQVKGFIAYIAAIKFDSPELAKDIAAKIYHHGDMLVQFLSIYNPYFPYAPEQKMFEEHLELQINQFRAYLEGRVLKAQELRQESIEQLQEFARHLAKAVQKQIESQQESVCYDKDGAVYKEELKYCCEPEEEGPLYYEQKPEYIWDQEENCCEEE